MRVVYVLGLALSLLPMAVSAQSSCPALQAGSTVRLHAPSAATYVLPQAVAPSDTAIVLPPAGTRGRMISCAELQKVQLRVGTRSRTRSTLTGAGLGLLAGAVIGAGVGYLTWEEDESGWEIFGRDETTVMGAVFMGGVGTVLGGVAGFAASPGRWQDVRLATGAQRVPTDGLRIAPAGTAQIRVSYTLPF